MYYVFVGQLLEFQDDGVAAGRQADLWLQKAQETLFDVSGSLRLVSRPSAGGVQYPFHTILEVTFLSRLVSWLNISTLHFKFSISGIGSIMPQSIVFGPGGWE